ncbi:hypothetical protein YSA_08570 [Pseudomonas putida ND6]|uniref:Uncharacterized protein n=1 Tax=Pseudomonas putida ND6 TaxID=231023 RepID=I3V0X9_PSEPU|nr:hypothetical protein YSA_08570 [Pseudomonas putida ND6]
MYEVIDRETDAEVFVLRKKNLGTGERSSITTTSI